MALVDHLLPEFDHEMATTRKLLQRVPEDRLSWKPHVKSFSLGQLAQHVANIPVWGSLTLERPDSTRRRPRRQLGRAAILAFFEGNAANARKLLVEPTPTDGAMVAEGDTSSSPQPPSGGPS
jgi:hypothetical protein